jgi:ribosomal protein S18 acetylase RimI-like enzyme
MISKMNTDNFIIREYRKGDFNGVSHLWIITDLGNPTRGDDESIIENSIRIGGSLLIMENIADGSICGTSWMTFDGRRIHLHHFGILPEYQGNGLSKILLKHSLEFVKKKGYQVKLEVHNSNKKASELYKKAGFSYLGDYDIYIIRDISKL